MTGDYGDVSVSTLYSVFLYRAVWGDFSNSFYGDLVWVRGLLVCDGISLLSITLDDRTLFKNIKSWLRPLDLRLNVVELSN